MTDDLFFEISVHFNAGGRFLNLTLTEGHKLKPPKNFFSFLKANRRVCFPVRADDTVEDYSPIDSLMVMEDSASSSKCHTSENESIYVEPYLAVH